MSRRVVLTCVGSYGDIHPFIAVALALRERGLAPVIAASEGYRRKIEAQGLDFHPVAPSLDQLLRDSGFTESDIIRNFNTQLVIDLAVTPYLERSFADLCEAMQGAALVVTCNFSMVARIAAEQLGLPVVSLLLSPCAFFSAAEPAHHLEAPWLPGFRRRFGVRATRFVLDLRRVKSRWQTRRITAFRRRLRLAVPRGDELLDGPLRADQIYGLYSPLLARLPADAPRNSLIVGYTFYDDHEESGVALPADLQAFLEAGAAPVVFTLGSSGAHAPGDFFAAAVAASRRMTLRAVLLVGPKADMRLRQLAAHDVLVANYAPYSRIFPCAAAVVHHGGIGTIGQALRAGRVQLVCPMFGDHSDNAERLVRLGVARRLDHARFTAERAAAALGELLADQAAIGKAARLGTVVAAEEGADVVADGIAALLARIETASGSAVDAESPCMAS